MKYFKNKKFVISSIIGFLLLVASFVVNYYAGTYATMEASSPVTDIILSNTRVFDVDGIFVYGTFAFWAFFIVFFFFRPKTIPLILKSIALFIFIRSVFITLTHIGPFPTQAIINSNILSNFSFGGDLFFSGHVGLPFLMALILWDDFRMRVLFIFVSLVAAVVVLLGHLHYSIDVLSAFFITYSIYRMAEIFFKKDKEIFTSGIN